MSNTKELLDQLRLERDEAPAATTAPARRAYWLALLAGFMVIGVTGSVLLLRSTPAAQAMTAAAASNNAAAKSTVIEQPATVANNDNAVLNASGYIVARREATVSAKLTARVTEVYIDEGQHVAQGDIIATLDDTNLKAAYQYAQAQLEQARASRDAANRALINEGLLFSRLQQQHQRGFSSAQDFDTAKARYESVQSNLTIATQTVAVADAALAIAARNLDDTKVRAPFSGIITVKAAQPGEMVSPISAGGGFTRTGIGTLVDMDSLEVDVDVSESFINRITSSQAVTVRLNAYPDWAIDGHVITVVPTADRAKATVKVRIALDNRDQRILPDMGVRVSFLRTDSKPTH